MDKIRIENLEVFANHGVFPEENKLGQKFLVSAVLYTDTRKAGMTDNLEDSIHYGEVCHKIAEFLQAHTYKLLERAAEQLCAELLMTTPGLEKLGLEVKKPWAPIGLSLETVSVEIERGWHKAYVALGSNMGDKEGYLNQAVSELKKAEGCKVEKVSDFLVTAPYGVTEQDDFLNGCLELRTLLSPQELLELLHKIEQKANRKRELRWGPRTLDLDILLYEDRIIDEEDLQIPHIEMHKRDFVLKPLTQIAPYAHHPIFGKTAAQLLESLEQLNLGKQRNP